MSGLKQLWGLGDPVTLDPVIVQRYESVMRAFSASIDRINVSLRFTAANAPSTSHSDLDHRRSQLILAYQKALGSQADARGVLQQILKLSEQLSTEAKQLAESTKQLKEQWELESNKLEAVEETIAQSAAKSPEVDRLQRAKDRIAAAIKFREYGTALNILKAMPGLREHPPAGQPPPSPARASEQRYPLEAGLKRTPVVPADPEALEAWVNPLVNGNPRDLFTTERMESVVKMQFAGQDSPILNDAMKGILCASPGDDISHHLASIGEQRGLDATVVQDQYERFLQLKHVATQCESAKGLPPADVTGKQRDEYLKAHGELLGSQSSLRFGQIVGEATGLDPAFAAMLSPAGGMVGPGLDLRTPANSNSPVVWNGIFQNAGDYLLNYQNSGAGHAYPSDTQNSIGHPSSDPLPGHAASISFWYERMQPERSVLGAMYEFDPATGDRDKKQQVYDIYTRHPASDSEELAKRMTKDSIETVRGMASEVRRFSQKSVKRIKSLAMTVADTVDKQIADAGETVDELAQGARVAGVREEMIAAAKATIGSGLLNVRTQVETWQRTVLAAIEAGGNFVENSAQGVERWTSDAETLLNEQTGDEAGPNDRLIQVAQDSSIQDSLQSGASLIGETKQDVVKLADIANREVQAAKQQIDTFYTTATATPKQVSDVAVQEFTRVKENLISKLDTVRDAANGAVDTMVHEMYDFAQGVAQTGQDIIDSAAGLVDSMADAMNGGTDTLAHAMSSATEFAADRLERLTNLLG